jgi:hypothetical protein
MRQYTNLKKFDPIVSICFNSGQRIDWPQPAQIQLCVLLCPCASVVKKVLVAEVAYARKDHCQTQPVGSFDNFLVAD